MTGGNSTTCPSLANKWEVRAYGSRQQHRHCWHHLGLARKGAQSESCGVEFGVTDAEGEGGRRTVTHEFPQRDLPYVEDMGLATAKFTIQAFVLGSDYMDRRDKLKAALEKPGGGTLVHPWLGELQVAQGGPYKLRETAQDGGMAVFTLQFVRSDAPSNPTGTVNSSRSAKLFGSAAGSQACSSFDRAFTIAGRNLPGSSRRVLPW